MTATRNELVPKWSKWLLFPDPRNRGLLEAPYGPGVYELRDRKTGQYILRGMGSNCAYRMSSILPKPLGQGTRNNAEKRKYVLVNLDQVEYRYCACGSANEAKQIEATRRNEDACLFNT